MSAEQIAAGLSEAEMREHIKLLIGWLPDGKVTAKDLAKKLGVSASYLSDVLNGKRGVADKLANALGYSVEIRFTPSASKSPKF